MPETMTDRERIEILETQVRVTDERIARAVMLEVMDTIADRVVREAVERITAEWKETFLPTLREGLKVQIRENLVDLIREKPDLTKS